MFRLSDGEEIMTLALFVLIQYRSVTDGQTDGQTDIPSLAIPAVCIARYANALVKMVRLINRKIIFTKIEPISSRYVNVTDGRTDGRTGKRQLTLVIPRYA